MNNKLNNPFKMIGPYICSFLWLVLGFFGWLLLAMNCVPLVSKSFTLLQMLFLLENGFLMGWYWQWIFKKEIKKVFKKIKKFLFFFLWTTSIFFLVVYGLRTLIYLIFVIHTTSPLFYHDYHIFYFDWALFFGWIVVVILNYIMSEHRNKKEVKIKK